MNPALKLDPEDNPFLGLRGIRLSFAKTAIFKDQLKAILEVAASYPVQMMFPMITSLEDVYRVKQLIEEAELELTQEGVTFKRPPLGVMIEVPTALVLTQEFSREVDFLSFGTNDLLQYTSASDRMNAQVASWYDPYQPAFLRLIHLAVQGANGMHVGMCGDLAGDERLLPFWSAIGIEEFGVPAAKLSRTKQILRRYPAEDQAEWIQSVLEAKTSREVIARLHRD